MSKPNVLLLDIETTPNLGYTWGTYEQNVIRFKEPWQVLSVAYKKLGDRKVHCVTQDQFARDGEEMLVKTIWEILDASDVVIAHNGDHFDLKKLRAKFVEYDLPPPSLYRTIDTLKIARSQFAFNSNRLNDLGETLKLGKKVETGGVDLWFRCMEGDSKAWALMEKYNKNDVVLLEKVYMKFRAWMPNHPNLAALAERSGCPSCGAASIQANGWRATSKGKQQRCRCIECGCSFTGKVAKKK